MKPSLAATLKILYKMNEVEMGGWLIFVACIMALTWYVLNRNGRKTASRPTEDESLETLQDQLGHFKVRLFCVGWWQIAVAFNFYICFRGFSPTVSCKGSNAVQYIVFSVQLKFDNPLYKVQKFKIYCQAISVTKKGC